ncbi:MAG: hypothetical protein J1E41_05680 [Ruminococcus sp.]|nr:hypothetical protein [Ruminococcus sp.]
MKKSFGFDDKNNSDLKAKRVNKTKPKSPAPPINAKRNPSVKVQDYSVYDEIAEHRRGRSTKKVDLSYGEEKGQTKANENVKDYEIFDNEIYSDSGYINSILNSEKKPKGNLGKWIVFIIILCVLCLGVSGIYLYVNGYWG